MIEFEFTYENYLAAVQLSSQNLLFDIKSVAVTKIPAYIRLQTPVAKTAVKQECLSNIRVKRKRIRSMMSYCLMWETQIHLRNITFTEEC